MISFFKKIFRTIVICAFFSQASHADLTSTIPDSVKSHQIPVKKEKQKTKKTAAPEFQKNGTESLTEDLSHHNSKAPVLFESDGAVASKKTGILTLINHVKISQDDMTLLADKAQLIGSSSKQPSDTARALSHSIKTAIATGNVEIYKKMSANTPDIKATCEKVTFAVEEKKLTLSGNAKIWKNAEYVHASTIEMDLASGDIHLVDPKGTVNPQSNTIKTE